VGNAQSINAKLAGIYWLSTARFVTEIFSTVKDHAESAECQLQSIKAEFVEFVKICVA
jgi:hypothetical protein